MKLSKENENFFQILFRKETLKGSHSSDKQFYKNMGEVIIYSEMFS